MTRAQLEEEITAEFGEPFMISYFSRSAFIEPTQTLIPWSLVARDKFKNEAKWFLKREGITLGKPNPVHMQPGAKRVIFKP